MILTNNKLMWWGYLHQNNTIQVKRWFGDIKDYSRNEDGDCHNNDFVVKIVEPFEATDYNQALEIIENKLKDKQNKV